MNGKVADVVMAVRNGEQIVRKYQPIVSNPSTPGQVASRAKLKLMSQLSAVMASVIAIRRDGAVSSRNMFVKENYPLVTYNNDTASANLLGIQLTKSVVSMPAIVASRGAQGITAAIDQPVEGGSLDVNRVVYALFEKESNNKLRFVASRVVTAAGTPTTWKVDDLPLIPNNECIVYAYGVRDNTNAARAIFGNMQAATGVDVANLIVSRTLKENDITITETRAVSIPSVQANMVGKDDDNRSVKKK